MSRNFFNLFCILLSSIFYQSFGIVFSQSTFNYASFPAGGTTGVSTVGSCQMTTTVSGNSFVSGAPINATDPGNSAFSGLVINQDWASVNNTTTITYTFNTPITNPSFTIENINQNNACTDLCGNSWNDRVTVSVTGATVVSTSAIPAEHTITGNATGSSVISPNLICGGLSPNVAIQITGTVTSITVTYVGAQPTVAAAYPAGGCTAGNLAGCLATRNNCSNPKQQWITISPIVGTSCCTQSITVLAADQTFCAGGTTTLTASASGTGIGSGATYSWTPGGATGASISVSPATTTTYTVTGTSSLGCVDTDPAIVTVKPLPIANANADVTICTGGSTTLSTTGSTGAAGTTYAWTSAPAGFTSALANPIVSPIVTTTYTLTVTLNGCSATDTKVVTVQSPPTITAGSGISVCAGLSSALSATGAGVGGTYVWNPGALSGSAPSVTPVSTTTYTVTGTTTGGCTGTTTQTVTVLPRPTVNAGADQSICAGLTANISAASSGTPLATSFSWSPGGLVGANQTVTPATTTTFTVTGAAANGCTATDAMIVNINPLPLANAGADITICTGQSSTLNATLVGATAYLWSPGSSTSPSISVNPSATTTYTCLVTGANGCQKSDAVIVTVVSPPVVTAIVPAPVCAGSSVTLTAAGATSYTWTPGGTGASVTISPSVTTTYSVVGSNGACASIPVNVTVTVNPLPVANANPDQTICAGSSATLSSAGSSAGTYNWNPGAIASASTSVTPAVTTTYTLTVTSASACVATDAVIVNVNPLPTVSAGLDQGICPSGSVTLTAAGASTYVWSPGGATTASITVNPAVTTTYTVTGTSAGPLFCNATDQVIVSVNAIPIANAGPDASVCLGSSVNLSSSGSGAGIATWNPGAISGASPSVSPSVTTTYTLTVTNAGCSSTDQVTITVNPIPTPSITGNLSYCAAGSGNLNTNIPYASYLWSTGASTSSISATVVNNPVTVVVTNNFGCTATTPAINVVITTTTTSNTSVSVCAGQSATIHGNVQTIAGVYSQTFIGGSITGCDSISNITLVVNPLPIVNAGVDVSICTGASTSLTASGATTYSWNNGITQNTSFAPTLTQTYIVTGTDVSGCTNTDQVLVTVVAIPSITVTTPPAICVGGSATAVASGASSYIWSNGTSTSSNTISPTITTVYTVTGSTSCASAPVSVTVTVNPLPVINAGVDQTVCAGTSTILSATGGVSYVWNPGNIAGSTVSVIPLVAAIYTVSGTDVNGCVNTDQVAINVNQAPIVSAGVDLTICAGTTVTILGVPQIGTTSSWNNGVFDNVPFVPSATTTYTFTAVDNIGCSNSDQVTIFVNPLPTINAGSDQTICVGGTAILTASGAGTGSYSWANGGNTAAILLTPAGTTSISVIGTDANGCQNVDQVVVNVSAPPVISVNNATFCYGLSAALTASGGSTYSWSPALGLSATTGAAVVTSIQGSTNYTVTGTDINGCTGTAVSTITVNQPAGANIINNNPSCNPNVLNWANWNNVTANGATGAVSSNIGVTLTHSTGGLSTTGSMFQVNNFPPQYAVPNGTTIRNDLAGLFTFCFTQPVNNPQIALSSIGNGANAVQVNTSVPYNVIWNGTNMLYPTSTAFIGQEGFSIISFPGTHSCISFDYLQSESYCNIAFGIQDTNCQIVPTICAGDLVNLLASGGVNYLWTPSAGLSAANLPNVAATPIVTTTYEVFVTDANGCVDSTTTTITVNPIPVIAVADQAVCDGTSATLTGPVGLLNSWTNGVTDATAFVPTVTQSYTLTSTNAAGCQNSDLVNVTVNPLPIVNVADITICAGSSATLTGPAGNTNSWNNTISNGVAFTPVATQTYTVTTTNSFGCVATDQAIVTVNPLPISAVADVIVCAGGSVTLGGPVGNVNSWTNGISDAVSFIPLSTLTYTLTSTNAFGCAVTDQVLVTVNSLPISAVPDQTICAGTAVTLAGPVGNTNTWDNSISNNTAFTPIATTLYTLTTTNANGCISTDQVNITVNPLPIADAGIDQTICLGDNVLLAATGAGIGGTYVWSNSILQGVFFVPSVATTTTYTVTATNSFGCADTDAVNVIVNPLPNVTIAPIGNAICDGTQITLTANGALNYVWTPTITNGSTIIPGVGVNNFAVIGTDANGCQNNAFTSITVNPNPVLAMNFSAATGCTPYTFTFENTGINSATCAWQIDNGPIQNNCGINAEFFNQAGCHDLTYSAISSNGCVTTQNFPSIVCVNATPVASFTVNPTELTSEDLFANFFNNSTGATNYIWNFGDGANANTFNAQHLYQYVEGQNVLESELIAISAQGCKDTVTRIFNIQEDLIFYIPNTFTPDDDAYNSTFFPVFTSGFDPQKYSMLIFDRWGELIFESRDAEVGWDGTYGGKLMQDGTYIWKIEFKTKANDKRVMKVGHVNILR
jgi:gliding motility-associated-like protein